MQYQITSDNIDISDSMKNLAKTKFEKVEKRLLDKEKDSALTRIVLNKAQEEDMFEVKIEFSYDGKKYFAHDKNFVLESAIINTVNQIERVRRKEDIAYYSDWKKQRKLKRMSPDDFEAKVDERFLDNE